MIEGKQNAEFYFSKEIDEQSEAIQNSLISSQEGIAQITSMANGFNNIILLGSGDCYFISFSASYVIEKLSGIQVRYYEAYDFYLDSPICENTLVIGFSSSGKSLYTVQSIKLAKSKGAITVGLTNNSDSQLALAADIKLLTDAKISYTFPTKTTTSALSVLFSLAINLGKTKRYLPVEDYISAHEEVLNAIPNSIRRLTSSQSDVYLISAKELSNCIHLIYIGSGSYRSTAMIGAAKIIETSRRHITACNAEEYLHLVGFSVRENDGVVIAANQTGNDREHLVAEYATKQGAKVVVVGRNLDAQDWPKNCLFLNSFSEANSDWADSLISMVSMHKLASELNLLSEKNPDIPDGVDLKYVINLLYTGPVAGWKTD